VPWWAILCCGIFAVLLLGAAIVLVSAVIRLGRASRRLQGELEPRLGTLELASAETQRRSAAAAASRQRLTESTARARDGYQGLLVLWAALEGVRKGLKRLRLARGLL
jgi:hypothetical protein